MDSPPLAGTFKGRGGRAHVRCAQLTWEPAASLRAGIQCHSTVTPGELDLFPTPTLKGGAAMTHKGVGSVTAVRRTTSRGSFPRRAGDGPSLAKKRNRWDGSSEAVGRK